MARQQRTASQHAVSGVLFNGPLVGMPPLACLSADRKSACRQWRAFQRTAGRHAGIGIVIKDRTRPVG